MRRKDDRREDPRYDFKVGQLIGAAQMAGWRMTGHEDPEVQRMGERLISIADWFVDEQDSWQRPPTLPPLPETALGSQPVK